MEGRLESSPNWEKFVPRGELIELLSKALLYIEVETHWKNDTLTANCMAPFTLLDTHVCKLDTSSSMETIAITSNPPDIDANSKRKAAESISVDESHKRVRRSSEDMDIETNASDNDCKRFYIWMRLYVFIKHLGSKKYWCLCYIAADVPQARRSSNANTRVPPPATNPLAANDRSKGWSTGPNDDAPEGSVMMLDAHKCEVRLPVCIGGEPSGHWLLSLDAARPLMLISSIKGLC